MLNLAEYRSRADRLADHLPWAALVAPGVILNKDGSFMRSFAFRGSDLESATEAELVSACARANNVLKRLGSGWALFFEAERREAPLFHAGGALLRAQAADEPVVAIPADIENQSLLRRLQRMDQKHEYDRN